MLRTLVIESPNTNVDFKVLLKVDVTTGIGSPSFPTDLDVGGSLVDSDLTGLFIRFFGADFV